jgi:hypothetical protein
MVVREAFTIGGVEYQGYQLGWVELTDHTGAKRRLQAYFIAEQEGEPNPHMLVVELDGYEDHWHEEHNFLGYYGVGLTWPLVWKVEGAADVPELRAWFPSYERWGE